MKPSTVEWIEKTESDYQLAVSLSPRRKLTFYDQAGFHAQQSAEKYLKARLEEADILSPRTHDLEKLLNLLVPIEPLWAALLQPLMTLSQYAVEFRYPGCAAKVQDMKNAIRYAKVARREARLAFGMKV